MEEMRSIKINALCSGLKTMLAIVFPLITFPYVTRIIGTDNYGKVSFVSSIITYFAMIAALGINNYAIREGASCRHDKEKFHKFSNQIFTINIITTIMAYFLLFCLWIFWGKIRDYPLLIMIQSIGIISTTIGVEWLYSLHENYIYITIRYIIVQIASLLLLFIFVRKEEDYCIYAAIIVFSNASANIINFIHARKYCSLKFKFDLEIIKHMKSILILFFNELSVLIYVNSDITILGIFFNDYTVGIYSVAAKIYSIVKSVLNAILIVSIPRLSNYASNGKNEEYNILLKKIQKILLLITVPSVIGIITLSTNIIQIVSGKEYIEAVPALRLLGIALIFSVGASLFGYILLTQRKEHLILKSTSIAAIVNIILNLILIPYYGLIVAAGTTALCELIVLSMNFYNARYYFRFSLTVKELIKLILSGVIVVASDIFISHFIVNIYIATVLIIFISITGIVIILLLFKDEFIYEIINSGKKKFRKNDRKIY